MAKREWLRMIRGGEGLSVEFKLKLPKLDRLARSFAAFSNSSGGTLFFGIEDDGTPVGLESMRGTREMVDKVAKFHCDPPVVFTAHEWEATPRVKVLVVEIPEASQKPVYAVNVKDPKDAWPFFRSGKENLPLDRKSLKAMRHSEALEPTHEEVQALDKHTQHMLNFMAANPRCTIHQLAKSCNIGLHRTKKTIVDLEKTGWIHANFNESRREYSLAIAWKNH